MHSEKKLGRGLSALLGDNKQKNIQDFGNSIKNEIVENISVNKITAGIYQPRRFFEQNELQELANSIKENGLLQPIILRKSDENHYEIIAGERRFRAIKILGLTAIPAIVKKLNNHQALEFALIENIQREDLSLVEEADGYKQLMEEFSYTQDDVAKKTGKSRSYIANSLRLLKLPEDVKDLINNGKISKGHSKVILASQNPELLARKIMSENLTVRDVEEIIRDEKINKLKTEPVTIAEKSNVKFINSGEVVELENNLSKILKLETKIHYNQFKNKGKISINFDDIESVYYLVEALKSL